MLENMFENSAVGYANFYNQGGWTFPTLGLWNIPEGEVELTCRNSASRFIAMDYFYLAPLFEVRGFPSVILPIAAWPAQGEWTNGAQTGAVSSMAERPDISAWIKFDASVSGRYALFATVWHPAGAQHKIDFEIESRGKTQLGQVVLHEDEGIWQTALVGSFRLDEGGTIIRFSSAPGNPRQPVAVESFLIVPQDVILRKQTEVERRRERLGLLLVDGLATEWQHAPVVVSDPRGDSAHTTDLKKCGSSLRRAISM